MVLEVVQSTGLLTVPLPTKVPLVITKFTTISVREVQRLTSYGLSSRLPALTIAMRRLAIPLTSTRKRLLCLIEPLLGTPIKSLLVIRSCISASCANNLLASSLEPNTEVTTLVPFIIKFD